MEVKLTKHELSMLRTIIFRYEHELETLLENNIYPEQYAGIDLEFALHTIDSLYCKICSAEWEIYEDEKKVRLEDYVREYLEEDK